MLNKVRLAINDFCLLSGVKTVAVALSGGADSVALLTALLRIKNEFNFEVFAAHYNHMLRGEESDSDEAFVKTLCEKLDVRLVLGSGDVSAYAKENHKSIEVAAREMRYSFFDTLRADAVATAHTASDNLETVILNLTRGSALDGLCGIPPKRGKYIRPLILSTREDVERFCNDNELSYVTDSTNLSDDYSRNRIRHNIVPVLKSINPAVEKNVLNTSLSLAYDRNQLDDIAKKEYQDRVSKLGLNVDNLTDEGHSIISRVLRMFCEEKTGIAPDFLHTEDLFGVAVNGGRCSLSGNAVAQRHKNILKITQKDNLPDYNVKIEKKNNIFIKKGVKVNNLLLNNLIDCDKIVGEMKVRKRQSGDKIGLLGRGCTKTLKQLYNENGIELNNRSKLPVISDDIGVIWVAGIGVAERVAVDCNSNFVYKISYEIVSGGNNTK